ncbi:MAG: peptidase domain-containing ABC transporter [Halieaceae bacterium]
MSSASHAENASSLLNFNWSRRLPLLRQTEASECGMACLAMVAGFHGLHIDLSQLRQRFPDSGQGVNLKQLIDMAGSLQLSARAIKADLNAIGQLQLPCVLHWDMNHFVVLKAVRRRHAVVHDPARGARKLSVQEFSEHYTGIALELTPSAAFEPEQRRRPMKLAHLWTRITGLKRSLAQVLLMSLLLQLFAVAAPFYVQTVVDDVVLRNDHGLLAALATGFSLLLILEVGTQVLRSSIILNLSTRLHMQLATNLFQHLLRLPLDYFQRRHLGDVLSRFGSIESVKHILSTGLVSAVIDGLMAVLMLTAMFLYDTRLTLIVLSILLIYLLLRIAMFPALRRETEENIVQRAQVETSFIESVRAIQTIKLFQREAERQGHWQNRLADTMNSDIRIARLGISFEAAGALLFGAENILVVYFAATAVMGNVISLGMFFAFMSYKRRFVDSMDSLITQIIEIKMLGVHLQRISDIAFTAIEPANCVAAPGEQEASYQLRASGIGFRYSNEGAPVFSSLDFTIDSGQTVAITGPSGCGKSTLLKCLMGLLRTSDGEILLNDIPLSHTPGYRALIAAVMQDDQLLSGSVADNIACFDHRLHLEDIARCAQQACIHDDIMKLPMQYNSPVGDMGSSLSGGQVQRIMLARAFYRRPVLLFLDEATSHLDIQTEQRINQHIAAMSITRILVAHRPETIALADHVIELRPDGRAKVSRNGA